MIRRVTGTADPAWQTLLALFKAEFPPSTREPDEELIAELEGHSRVPYQYVVDLEGEEVKGFVRFARMDGFLFIVHIATDSRFRRAGTGYRLLAAVKDSAPDLPVVCEVEPGEAMDWWTRQGARTVTPTYTQPALRPETPPMPFHLTAIGDVDSPRELVLSFYLQVWGLDDRHPLVRAALEGVR